MKHTRLILVASALIAIPSFAAAQSRDDVMKKITEANNAIKTFQADLEIRDKQDDQESTTSMTLTVSREHGWKMENTGAGEESFIVVNDFNTNWSYAPARKEARKDVADRPEIKDAFRKPARDINPVTLLDQATLKFIGPEEFNGEKVFHMEGTTTTQLMAQGRPVNSRMELWISTEDGLPRKTVEWMGKSQGTTIYRNVKVNIPLSADDFKFEPPSEVTVIDGNEEMKRMMEAARSQQNAPAPSKKK